MAKINAQNDKKKVSLFKKWYQTHDNWGLKFEKKEQMRLQLLMSEVPSKPYKRVLIVTWRASEIWRQSFSNAQLTQASFLQNELASSDRLLADAQDFLALLAQLVSKKQTFDLIVFDRVLYTDVIGHSISLIQLYTQKLLKKNGLLMSCSLDVLGPPKFPFLLLQESFLDLMHYHYRLKAYIL